MPKEKKEKKSKAVETVEDVEMKNASPKVRVGVEMGPKVFGLGEADFQMVYRRKRRRNSGRKRMNRSLFPKILAPLPSHWPKKG